MAKPPTSFEHEKGNVVQRCGSTWPESIVVTGQVPGRGGLGKNVTHKIMPVTLGDWVPVDSKALVGKKFGRDEEAADDLRDKIVTRIITVRNKAIEGEERGLIKPKELDAIKWLMARAEAELAAAFKIFDKWRYREWGSFPLDRGDTLEDFDTAYDPSDCNEYGRTVYSSPPGNRRTTARCPYKSELKKRPLDRARIVTHFEDALAHVRCAEYWTWRIWLVRKVLADQLAPPPVLTGGTQVPPDDDGGAVSFEHLGQIQSYVWAVDDPWDLPDPDLLPPPEELPEPDDDEGGPEGEGFEPEAPSPAKPNSTKAVALGVAGVALGWLLLKRLS